MRRQRSKTAGRLRVISVAEMQAIRDRLERSLQCGPALQAVVIESMAEYKGSYYQTPRGNLCRVFSKDQEAVLFSPASLSLLKQKLKVQDPMKRPEWAEQLVQGGTNAAGQP